VTALRAYDGGWIVELTDDQTAPVSRRHAPALKQRLGIV
jgi:DNA-binding LytR/AlgR family response regulator